MRTDRAAIERFLNEQSLFNGRRLTARAMVAARPLLDLIDGGTSPLRAKEDLDIAVCTSALQALNTLRGYSKVPPVVIEPVSVTVPTGEDPVRWFRALNSELDKQTSPWIDQGARVGGGDPFDLFGIFFEHANRRIDPAAEYSTDAMRVFEKECMVKYVRMEGWSKEALPAHFDDDTISPLSKIIEQSIFEALYYLFLQVFVDDPDRLLVMEGVAAMLSQAIPYGENGDGRWFLLVQ